MCHTASGHGPFALETYRDVRRRSELVRQELLQRTMPPCIATTDFGEFCLSASFNDEELVMLQEWLRADAPLGGQEPPPPVVKNEFRLGTPDVVLKPLVEPDLPKEGNPVWCAVVIDPGLRSEVHLRGFDIVPQEPQAIRHVLLGVLAPGVTDQHWTTNGTLDAKASRLIGAWAPGYPAWKLPDDVSMTLHPGERLVAQVLVQPNGRPQSTQFELGLYHGRVRGREAKWVTLETKQFEIAAFEELTVTNNRVFDRTVDLLAVLPEARFYAYSMSVFMGGPENPQSLFKTIKWNPYWTGTYVYKQPVRIQKGTTVTSHFIYENERHTLINEGKMPRVVHSGSALNEEVCRTHFLVAEPSQR